MRSRILSHFDLGSAFHVSGGSAACKTIGILLCLALGGATVSRAGTDASDPGNLGPYAIGHTTYLLTDTSNGARPVSIMVWYPVDPSSVRSSPPPAKYPLDPFTGTTYLPHHLVNRL